MKKNTAAKKYFSIYIGVVMGLLLLLFAPIVIVEIQTRLQPDNQVLYVAPEESSADKGILKIYARGNVWNKDKTAESKQSIEMQLGETIYVGQLRKAMQDQTGQIYTYHFTGSSAVTFIAAADADLQAEHSIENYPIYCGKPGKTYLEDVTLEYRDELAEGRYEMVIEFRADHEQSRKSYAPIPDDELGSGEWTKELRTDSYIQYINEVYPQINNEYVSNYRRVSECALLISAYDKSNPDRLIAQAEIKITCHSRWESSLPNIVWPPELTLTPDSYGYTTAELVDYWELEEWE